MSSAVLATAATTDTDVYQIGALIPYASTKQYMVGCNIAYNHSTSQFTPTWLFMNPENNIDLTSNGGDGTTSVYTDSKNLGTAKYALAGTTTALGTNATVSSDSNDSSNTNYFILAGSTASLDSTKTTISCTTKVKYVLSNLNAAATANTYMDGVAEGTNSFFFGATTSGSTHESKL